jgi:signal transduction histidine kinase
VNILRDRRRNQRSIKARLTSVVLFSNIALLVMWAVVSLPALFDAVYLRVVNVTAEEILGPSVASLKVVQDERRLTLQYQSPQRLPRAELEAQRKKGDAAVGELREMFEPLLDLASDDVRNKWGEFDKAFNELSATREGVDTGRLDANEAFAFYNRCADVGLDLYEALTRFEPHQEASYNATSSIALFRANDLLARAQAIVSSAFATGGLSETDHARVTDLVGAYHQQLFTTTLYVTPETKDRYRAITESDSWQKLTAAEQRLITAGSWSVAPPNRKAEPGDLPPISQQEWTDLTTKVLKDLEDLATTQVDGALAIGTEEANFGLIVAAIGSLLALAVAIAVIRGANRVTRMITSRLNQLRDDTLQLADERLPEIVDRLRVGEKVDVATEVPTLDHGEDEIGQVAAAFNTAQATAVSAAVQESQAREGVNTVFLGIAHRSQALVHRQLKILDELEREQEDAQALDALFRLDHLATRARRNAENLIILGGGQPGRKWRNPVLLADILRSATAETEHYARVRMQGIPKVSLIGSSVADMVHLVSELLDNATSFSPPKSQVRLSAEVAAKGMVVEIEDNGLGMEEKDRERANAMLADPPEFDAMALRGESRLGLFVVARLAMRHGIRVELRSSSYGGIRAIVLIPADLLTPDEDGAEPRNEPRVEEPPELAAVARTDISDTIPPPTAPPPSFDTGPSPNERTPPGFSMFEPVEDFNDGIPPTSRSERPPSRRNNESSASSTLSDFWADSIAKSIAEETQATGNASRYLNNHAEPDPWSPSKAEGTGPVPTSSSWNPPRNGVTDTGSEPIWPGLEASPAESSMPNRTNTGQPPPLPRRRRQASLAPQLRENLFVPEEEYDVTEGRSPEEIRNMMSSFQHNSNRARNVDSTDER